MGRHSLHYKYTDYMFACPCSFRYDRCSSKKQLELIHRLHSKNCSVAQNGGALNEGPSTPPKIYNDGKSYTKHIDEILAFHEANSS